MGLDQSGFVVLIEKFHAPPWLYLAVSIIPAASRSTMSPLRHRGDERSVSIDH